MEWLAGWVQWILTRWGYLALAGCLLGENAGLPLPGETILMYSSFVARKTHELNIVLIIVVATAAAMLGDNLGYWAGKRLGPRLLRWLERRFHLQEDIATARDQIRCHGRATIFWARYIVGLRTVAGPVAGALNMEWKTFLLYNALGAISWVTTVALIAFAFGNKIDSLAGYIEKVSWVVSGGIFAVGYFLWRRKKKLRKEFGNACATPGEKRRAA
jgi:membrane protein DedA with SNARE-associated domain